MKKDFLSGRKLFYYFVDEKLCFVCVLYSLISSF